jgi:hypothetical protein
VCAPVGGKYQATRQQQQEQCPAGTETDAKIRKRNLSVKNSKKTNPETTRRQKEKRTAQSQCKN